MIRTALLLVAHCCTPHRGVFFTHEPRRREPLPAQATGLQYRAQSQAAAAGRCRAHRTGRPRACGRVATASGRVEAGDARAMAAGTPSVLALEVAAFGAPSASRASPAIDRGNGESEPDLGRRTNCRGAAREAGPRRLAADGQAIHAAANPDEARFSFANVEYVCRNHATEILACDFFVTATVTFRLVFVFLVMEIGTRRILHWTLTEHPTAEWTTQQFRSVVTGDEPYRLVLHDRDAVFASDVDDALRSMNLRVLKTPARVPQANAFCERLIGTARRECLDHVIALNERHLRKILADWVRHYNRGRPHAALGPGIPDPSGLTVPQPVGHQIPSGQRVVATPILGGLHHEYRLESVAA
jgi:transposase InsO family protein